MKRYVNRKISERIVRTNERHRHDYLVIIKQTGRDVRNYHISIAKKQKELPYYVMSIYGVKKAHDITSLLKARQIQDSIVKDLRKGANVMAIINGEWRL